MSRRLVPRRYAVYPLMVLLFLSKSNHLRSLLQHSYMSIYVPFYHMHDLHVKAGIWVTAAITLHSVCHIIRWALQGNILFLFQTQTGETGFWCGDPLGSRRIGRRAPRRH